MDNIAARVWLGITLDIHIGIDHPKFGHIMDNFHGDGEELFAWSEEDWIKLISGGQEFDKVAIAQGAHLDSLFKWLYDNEKWKARIEAETSVRNSSCGLESLPRWFERTWRSFCSQFQNRHHYQEVSSGNFT